MNTKKRAGVFETNSSSVHSVVIESSVILDSILPDDKGFITIKGDQFGWGWDKSNDAYTKASYCLTMVLRDKQKQETLREVIQSQTLCKEVILITQDLEGERYYIDHQSISNLGYLFDDKELLRNFIFNKNCWLFIGNDNDDPPYRFYEPEPLIYRYRLLFPDFPILPTYELLEYPLTTDINSFIAGKNFIFIELDGVIVLEENPIRSKKDDYFFYEPTKDNFYEQDIKDLVLPFVRKIDNKSFNLSFKVESNH